MARTALDALLSRLLVEGVELELLGGLNFAGFTLTDEGGYYTVRVTGVGNADVDELNIGANLFIDFNIGANQVLTARVYSAGMDLFGNGIIGVGLLNGAAPLAPVEGTALADANANLVATEGSQRRIPTLTANRTYDINNTGAVDEETIVLYRTGTEAFTATIRDNADATIATFPASTKLAGAFKKATGGNFQFTGFWRLA